MSIKDSAVKIWVEDLNDARGIPAHVWRTRCGTLIDDRRKIITLLREIAYEEMTKKEIKLKILEFLKGIEAE